MGQPTFSFAYTSIRPAFIPEVVNHWTERAKDKNSEWCIAVDANQPETIKVTQELAQKNPNVHCYVQDKPPFNSVKGWNLAAEKTTGKIIIVLSDDWSPPNFWDEKLLSLKPTDWPEGEHVIHINDGFVKTLCTLPILTRKRYEKFGYLFYFGYESLFSDTEFTEVAYRDGVVIEALHLLFEHLHPDCNKRQRDSVDLVHASDARWRRGEMLFNYRKFQGFPIDQGPKAVANTSTSSAPATIIARRTYAAYMQVNRDDFCLFEVCQRLFEEGVKDFFWAVPDRYWTDDPTTEDDYAELHAVKERLTALGLNIDLKIFNVERYRLTGDSRIVVETRLRNDSLDWIRHSGFHDILIVDGDELWKRGTLDKIEQRINEGASTVSTCMIPVIGLPGYPVERATDKAVVYISEKLHFQTCRSPTLTPVVVDDYCIYHFTGTRRTTEEIIKKHRASGHYDDPLYDFETWIKEVLPNIKPGFTYSWPNGVEGVHMYLPWSIWNGLRNWGPDDKAEIPESLWKYLGF